MSVAPQHTRLAAVVVTYNRQAALQHTLDAYLEAGVDQLIVVDNASTDGTAAYLAQKQAAHQGRLHVLTQKDNLGGAGGFHEGIRYARDAGLAEWLVISDDDSFPGTNALATFRNRLLNGVYRDCSLVAARVVFPDGELCPMNRPMTIPSPMSLLRNLMSGGRPTQVAASALESEATSSVLAASFVGLFVNTATLQKSDVLPEKAYFLYWDDIAFCLDMRRKGMITHFDPALTFVHDCPRSSKKMADERLYYMVRNGYRTLPKLPLSLRLLAYPYKSIHWLCLAVINRSLGWYFKALKEI